MPDPLRRLFFGVMGSIDTLETGGAPVGMFPDSSYEEGVTQRERFWSSSDHDSAALRVRLNVLATSVDLLAKVTDVGMGSCYSCALVKWLRLRLTDRASKGKRQARFTSSRSADHV
jgi:hypothetical protein